MPGVGVLRKACYSAFSVETVGEFIGENNHFWPGKHRLM